MRERLSGIPHRLRLPPDLVVEIVSPLTRRYDIETKRHDYERSGVGEYWIIDPPLEAFHFLGLQGGAFSEKTATEDRFASDAAPGFVLNLTRIRERFSTVS